MSATAPPVELKNHCSVIHDGVLYVYSPDAFLTLPLKSGGQWNKETNGVSVTGATCVKGGVDGDNSQPALYVVGGAANDSSKDYPGMQRYNIKDKSWTTITPVVPVTQNRQYHGAAYMNASSAIVIYGGSQNGYNGPSSETFLMLMYPPYRVQAYSSLAPPSVKPFMFSWTEDRALMAGGTSTNQNMYTFGPADGWQDLGLALPLPLPDPSVAQAAIFTLDDNSRILQTFDLGSTPVSITTNVLLNPGGQIAAFGETVGGSVTTASSSTAATAAPFVKRGVFLNSYPTYNVSNGPQTSRNGFSIAQGEDGLVAFVGGDSDNSVAFFNQSGNGWVQTTQLLGAQLQNPLATSAVTSSATLTATSAPTSTSSSAASSGGSDKTNNLTLLGGVLGGICGLAAILLILLLWLRSVRKRKQREQRRRSEYPNDKRRSGEYSFEEGLQPLSRAGQPMGRSPVPSAVIINGGDSTATYGPRPSEKNLIRRVSSGNSNQLKLDPQIGSGHTFGRDLFKREKSTLTISKPMLPDLGDYKDRPSIELGRATPAAPVVAASTIERNKSQRKTDEGWAKYFTGDRVDPNAPAYAAEEARPTSRGKTGSFWPGSGVAQPSPRSAKFGMRDSTGAALQPRTVVTASPNLELRPHGEKLFAQGQTPRISRATSLSTDMSDEYEDDHVDPAFSSGIPASVQDSAWTPVGNTWSGPPQRPLRPPSIGLGAYQSSSSGQTSDTSNTKSSIPNFPMPNSTVRQVRPSGNGPETVPYVPAPAPTHVGDSRRQPSAPHVEEARDYFSTGSRRDRDNSLTNNDMSWLNLGTPSNNHNADNSDNSSNR